MENTDVLIIGGDKRMIYLAEILYKKGVKMKIFGIEENRLKMPDMSCNVLREAIEKSRVIILPLPAVKDKEFINAPYFEGEIRLETILSAVKEDNIVVGGKLPESFKMELEKRNIKYYDYFECETLTMKNAAITAECAIMTAIQNSDKALVESKCVISGFGRIARFLAKFLYAMGAEVSILARSEAARAEAELLGYKACKIEDKKEFLKKCDFIFNTVPSPIFTAEDISSINEGCTAIELASAPGGFDLTKAVNKNIIQALALPGKFAPETSARIIYDTIADIL